MTRSSPAAHVTKRATLHTVASTRTRHAGNYMRDVPGMGRRIDILEAQMKTAPGCANTNRGLTPVEEGLMMTIVRARSDSATEARD